METKFNFKSSVCTSLVQSERLLALGLKAETADMVYSYVREEHEDNYYWELDILESSWDSYIWPSNHTFVPAWSLGRLLEMLPGFIQPKEDLQSFSDYAYLNYLIQTGVWYNYDDYDTDDRTLISWSGNDFFSAIVDAIEWLIKEGYFNKEYLV